MGEASLWWGLLFGSIGLGYLVYGRRQKAAVPLLCGIALIAFPYFVANVWAMLVVGALLLAVPWFVRI